MHILLMNFSICLKQEQTLLLIPKLHLWPSSSFAKYDCSYYFFMRRIIKHWADLTRYLDAIRQVHDDDDDDVDGNDD